MKLNPVLKGMLVVEVIALIAAATWRVNLFTAQRRLALQNRQTETFHTKWRPARSFERQAAIASIHNQLDAFKANDFQRAATYQSDSLRANFISAVSFQKMIRQSYPQFARYRAVRFGPAHCSLNGNRLMIPVTLTGADGITVHAMYRLVMERNLYRVDGVIGGSPLHYQPAIPNEIDV